ncbi:TPA: divergent polysaccharide deacetylase family protein, partial [Campylobacter jejuni]|nr:divergent polysaccharide deacetylase family protein [Campylobacter jejuni]
MSKKKLVQIQRYLIIAILFLLCIALALGILIKYQDSQNITQINTTNIVKEDEIKTPSIFKDHVDKIDVFRYVEIFDQNIENNHSIGILDQKMQEIDDLNTSLNEQNLSNADQNLTQNQNFILKDENLTQE